MEQSNGSQVSWKPSCYSFINLHFLFEPLGENVIQTESMNDLSSEPLWVNESCSLSQRSDPQNLQGNGHPTAAPDSPQGPPSHHQYQQETLTFSTVLFNFSSQPSAILHCSSNTLL